MVWKASWQDCNFLLEQVQEKMPWSKDSACNVNDFKHNATCCILASSAV